MSHVTRRKRSKRMNRKRIGKRDMQEEEEKDEGRWRERM